MESAAIDSEKTRVPLIIPIPAVLRFKAMQTPMVLLLMVEINRFTIEFYRFRERFVPQPSLLHTGDFVAWRQDNDS